MSLIKVVPYVLGMTPGVPGAPEPRMYPRSGYFLVITIIIASPCIIEIGKLQKMVIGIGRQMLRFLYNKQILSGFVRI